MSEAAASARAAIGPRFGEPPARAWAGLAARLGRGPVIAAVNFHSTPSHRGPEFAAQARRLAARFDPLTEAGLEAITAGHRPSPRPVVMPVLYEGFRDNLDVLLPLLEEVGLTAWLMIPPGFLEVEPEDQRVFAAAHDLILPTDEYPGERIALTWDELRGIAARGHVVCCHTRSHAPLSPDTPDAVLEWEIASAQALLRRRLGRPSRVFCWGRGAAAGVNPRADAMLRREGFRFLVSHLRVQRLA